MKTYEVTSHEIHEYRWTVEANSPEEAELVVEEHWEDGKQVDAQIDYIVVDEV